MPASGYKEETKKVVYEWLKLKSSDELTAAIEKKGVAWLKENFSRIDDLYQVAGGRGSHPATGEDFFCPLLSRSPVQQVMMSLMTVLNKHKLLLPLLTQRGVKEGELDIFLELLEEFQRYYKSYDPAVVVELEKQLQAQELQYDRKQVKGLKQTIEQIQQDGEEQRKLEEDADKAFALKMGQGDVELRDTNTKIKEETPFFDDNEWVHMGLIDAGPGPRTQELQKTLLSFKAQLGDYLKTPKSSLGVEDVIKREFCNDFFEEYDKQLSQESFSFFKKSHWAEDRLTLDQPGCRTGTMQRICERILEHARDSKPDSRTNQVIRAMQSEAEKTLQTASAAPSENAASEASPGPRPGRP